MKTDRTWIDREYEFEGQWDVPSKCGLRVGEKNGIHVFVVTELFTENPGTSVTNFCAQLATILRNEFDVPPDRFVFIEHCPDRGSRLEFQQETFHRVELRWDGTRFNDPAWKPIPVEEVERMIGKAHQ